VPEPPAPKPAPHTRRNIGPLYLEPPPTAHFVRESRHWRTTFLPQLEPPEKRGPHSFIVTRVFSVIVLVVSLGAAVGVGLVAVVERQTDLAAQHREVLTTARVVEARTEPASHNQTFTYYVITFDTWEGATIVADLSWYDLTSPQVVGGTLIIRYDSAQPDYIPYDARTSRSTWNSAVLLFVIAAFLAVFGIVTGSYLFRLRSRFVRASLAPAPAPEKRTP